VGGGRRLSVEDCGSLSHHAEDRLSFRSLQIGGSNRAGGSQVMGVLVYCHPRRESDQVEGVAGTPHRNSDIH